MLNFSKEIPNKLAQSVTFLTSIPEMLSSNSGRDHWQYQAPCLPALTIMD
jgi:hypothetical protein